MPRTSFDQLPTQARVWVFASDRPLTDAESDRLLTEVDAFLDQWKAHGAPLRSAREWRDNRFLAIGVDPREEQASGCSIDGLFRGLRQLEQQLGTALMAGGRVFYRDAGGAPTMAQRSRIAELRDEGALSEDSRVFDTTITDAGSWRERFERPARDTWVGGLLRGAQASQPSRRSATNSSSVRKG